MAEMTDILSRVMSDPNAMKQISALAQSLGLQNAPASPPPQPAPQPAPKPPAPPAAPPDAVRLMNNLLQMSSRMGGDERQLALIRALKPFLRPERAAKLDMAIQVARMSRLAGSSLQSLSGQMGGGR